MPFPISRTRTFQVPSPGADEASSEPVLEAIEAWLQARGARRVERSGGALAFRAGFLSLLSDWRKSTSRRLAISWNPLMTVGSGWVQVTPIAGGLEVTYSLRFVELIVVSFIFCLIFLGAMPETAAVSRWVSAGWFGLIPLGYVVASLGIGLSLEKVARKVVADPDPA